MKYTLDYDMYMKTAETAIAEGQVLLKNENNVLPLPKGSDVAVFGRMQHHYFKSGTGSGGMVNVNRVIGIMDALKEASDEGRIKIYEPLEHAYLEWEKEHPYDAGIGWAGEPDSQLEMPLEDETVKEAGNACDYAVVIIARLAGEDKDNKNIPGSLKISDGEKDMLNKVTKAFDKVILIFNTGYTMDMTFLKDYRISAVLMAWQGGMLGGLGTVDVLTGAVNPSGKLADTIAAPEDYPSYNNFGDEYEAVYEEDIFVGYRYFETFAKDKVIYPFGYGLSYTTFEISVKEVMESDDFLKLDISVTNTGNVSGKEVVQIYVGAPLGKLSKPSKVLVGFAKTKELKAGESQSITMDIPYSRFASFDDDNRVGLGTGFVLEKGTYRIYVGNDVARAGEVYALSMDKDILIESLINAIGPVKAFKRMTVMTDSDGSVGIGYEDAPLRKDTMKERRYANLPAQIPLTGDKGYKLSDVAEGRVTMDEFIAQLSVDELCTIIRGEGMSSGQVTPGTASAFGGIIPSLKDKGIPTGCMDDGPSGMRLDSGLKAVALPCGTLLACTFNTDLNEELFGFLGIEMLKNKVDVLLGPGMNIHRHPLNGRNFEYFSEDPFLTGVMGSAQIRGLKSRGVTGTIKHFACNNQETGRMIVNPVVSERALREIYLKGFEIAVKEGHADSVMTTYCQINGVFTSGNYDLVTTVLRNQWGFKGIVMTDWWARISEEDVPYNKTNFAGMVRAQNDMYMCVPGATADVGDNAREEVAAGNLTIGELQRTAGNICGFFLDKEVFGRTIGKESEVNVVNAEEGYDESIDDVEFITVGDEVVIDLSNMEITRDFQYDFGITFEDLGIYDVTLTGTGLPGNELAQLGATVYINTAPICALSLRGDGVERSSTEGVGFYNISNVMHIKSALGGIKLKELKIKASLKGWQNT